MMDDIDWSKARGDDSAEQVMKLKTDSLVKTLMIPRSWLDDCVRPADQILMRSSLSEPKPPYDYDTPEGICRALEDDVDCGSLGSIAAGMIEHLADEVERLKAELAEARGIK